jgi:hypothetical protein
MMMKKILLFCVLLLALQSYSQVESEKYQRAKIYYNGNEDFQRLSQLGIALDHGVHKRGYFFISEFSISELDTVREAGYKVDVLIEDAKAFFLEQNRNPKVRNNNFSCNSSENDYVTPVNFNFGSMGGYYTYQEALDELTQMQALYPNLISPATNISGPDGDFLTEGLPDNSVTPSIGGNGIKWLKISDNPNIDEEDEKEILYTSIHHAREPASLTQLIFYMWYLLENYETDPEIKTIVDNTELYFVPVVNPDGYLYNEVTDPQGGGFWRKNRKNGHGTDNNRNYNYFIDGNPANGSWSGPGSSGNTGSQVYHGTAPFSEVENQAMKQFVEDHEFILALNNHTFGELLYYPFSYADVPTEDEALYQQISAELTSKNGYFPLRDFPFSGDSDDFMHGSVGTHDKIFSFTPEVGQSFWPSQDLIIPLAKEMMYLNLTAARMTSNYAKIEDTSPFYVGDQATTNASFNIKNLGITGNGNFSVSLNPVSSNISSVGNPIEFTEMELLEETDDVIEYTLEAGISSGDEIIYELILNNGIYDSTIQINKKFGALASVFEDLGDSTTTNYNNDGWITTNSAFVSPSSSITDSNGNYFNNTDKKITINSPIDLTNATGAIAEFYALWEIENDFDYVQFQVSTDGGVTWEAQCGRFTNPGSSNDSQPTNEPLYDGFQSDWILEEIDLNDYLGSNILVRFQLVTDNFVTEDGFYFDDLKISVLEESSLSTEQLEASQFSIYPNPVKDVLNINTAIPGYEVEIYNLQGQLMRKDKIESGSKAIDYSSLTDGVYILKLVSGSVNQVFKLIKQ